MLGLWQPQVLNDAINSIIAREVAIEIEEVEIVATPEQACEEVAEDAETTDALVKEVEAAAEEVIEETTDENLDNNGDVL